MFSDKNKFTIGEDGVTHFRDINKDSTWADRVINGVDLDDTCFWDSQSEYLSDLKDYSDNQETTTTMINDRSMSREVQESTSSDNFEKKGSGSSKNWIGHGKSTISKTHRNWVSKNLDIEVVKRQGDKTFFRKRKIPRSKRKNYSVKPQRDDQKEKRHVNQEKYSEIVHPNEFEEKIKYEDAVSELFEKNRSQLDDDYEYYSDVEYRIFTSSL